MIIITVNIIIITDIIIITAMMMRICCALHQQLPSYSIWPTLLPSRSTVDPQQTTLNKMKMKTSVGFCSKCPGLSRSSAGVAWISSPR